MLVSGIVLRHERKADLVPTRRIVVQVLLALSLLCAQLLLAAHLLSHGARWSHDHDNPATPVDGATCVLCAAAAHFGDALPGTGPPLFVASATVFELAAVPWTYFPPVALAFSSRAPPVAL